MIDLLKSIRVLRYTGQSMKRIILMNRNKDRMLERLNQIIESIKNSIFTISINRDKRMISMIILISM